MAAADLVSEYLAALPGDTRRVDHAEWGLTVAAEQAGGWPLDVGLRIHDGLLRVQAFAAAADAALDPWLLMHWNRQTRLVRFGAARSGDIWVHGDAPVAGLDEAAVDRLLGLVVQAAVRARDYSVAATEAAAGAGTPSAATWLSGAARPPAGD